MARAEEAHATEIEGLRATADSLADEIDENKKTRGQMALSLAQVNGYRPSTASHLTSPLSPHIPHLHLTSLTTP